MFAITIVGHRATQARHVHKPPPFGLELRISSGSGARRGLRRFVRIPYMTPARGAITITRVNILIAYANIPIIHT